MFSRANNLRRRAFTLIEVMIAVVIITFLMVSIYRFVRANLLAIRTSRDVMEERQELNGLVAFLQTELADLPAPGGTLEDPASAPPNGNDVPPGADPSRPNNQPPGSPYGAGGPTLPNQRAPKTVLIGTPKKFNNLAADELQWLSRGGHGLLTTAADEDYRVTLAIQPVEKSSQLLEIGLRRQRLNGDERTYNWLPLMRPAAALEIRFYDGSLHTWVERWSEPQRVPALVRVRVWKTAEADPVEAVLSVPSWRLQDRSS